MGDAVRLFTRRGYDWSGRYPAIVRAAAKLRARSFTIDGAAVCGPDGIAFFDALQRATMALIIATVSVALAIISVIVSFAR
jgi:ATP-dependent DNA ligase